MITLVYGDDWMGVYKDGECVYQNHSIEPSKLLRLVGVEYQTINVDMDWLAQEGFFPVGLEDIVEE